MGLFVAFLVVVYGTTLAVMGGLDFETYKDEEHFLSSARLFNGAFPPTVEQLRSYPEVLGPLAFVVWGQLDRITGDGLGAGRALNVLASIAIVCLIALRRGRPERDRWLAAGGLMLFPYFLPLSIHLYTDVFALALALLGLHLHRSGRPLQGMIAMILAISARQYMVALPTALTALEAVRFLGGDRRHWTALVGAGLAAGSLLGWFAFFGGLAPAPGIAEWLPRYPAPMESAFAFIPEYGLYFLTCMGAYFAVPELLLHRSWPSRRWILGRRSLVVAAILLILFAIFPPIYPDRHQGALDRAALWLLPEILEDPVRLIGFLALAWLAVVRLSARLDLAFWILLFSTLLQMKSQLSWDKYALPALAFLWYLESRGDLDDGWRVPWPGTSDDASATDGDQEVPQAAS